MSVSVGSMLKQVDGLRGTDDLSDWEDEFVESVMERSADGKDTTRLSEKQVSVIERIYKKHFA